MIEKEWQSFCDQFGLGDNISESSLMIARLTFYAGAAAVLNAFSRPDTDVSTIVAELDAIKAEVG